LPFLREKQQARRKIRAANRARRLAGHTFSMNPKPASPNPSRLETAILVVSFLLLWAWWLERQAIYRAGNQPSLWTSAPLVLLVAALAWVFARRLKRVVAAMKEQRIGLGKK